MHNFLSLSCLLYNLQCIHSSGVEYIQAVLSVILTIVPRQHVLKLNKHGNVNKSLPINIYILIAGLENKYFFGKLERLELSSQMGGELMS